MAKMLLKSLVLHRDFSHPELLTGKASFESQCGEVTINIDAEKASKILTILAEEMVETAKGVANMMTSQIIEQAASGRKLSAPTAPSIDDISF